MQNNTVINHRNSSTEEYDALDPILKSDLEYIYLSNVLTIVDDIIGALQNDNFRVPKYFEVIQTELNNIINTYNNSSTKIGFNTLMRHVFTWFQKNRVLPSNTNLMPEFLGALKDRLRKMFNENHNNKDDELITEVLETEREKVQQRLGIRTAPWIRWARSLDADYDHDMQDRLIRKTYANKTCSEKPFDEIQFFNKYKDTNLVLQVENGSNPNEHIIIASFPFRHRPSAYRPLSYYISNKTILNAQDITNIWIAIANAFKTLGNEELNIGVSNIALRKNNDIWSVVFTGGKIIPSNTLLNNQWFLNLQDLVQLERVLKCRLKTLISRSNVGEVNNVLNSGQITSNSTTNSTRTPCAIIPRRHRRAPLRDSIQKITKADIRRLARRGGVKRINGQILNEVRGVLKVFLGGIIQDATELTLYKKRKTVHVMDIIYALKRHGRLLYGFG